MLEVDLVRPRVWLLISTHLVSKHSKVSSSTKREKDGDEYWRSDKDKFQRKRWLIQPDNEIKYEFEREMNLRE